MDTMWIIKIAIKLILGRLPFKHQLLRSLNLFRHGKMDDPAYALKIFRLHFKQAPESLVVLELGPGDSLASALIAKAHGAKKVYLVDVGSYAKQSVKSYQIISNSRFEKNLRKFFDWNTFYPCSSGFLSQLHDVPWLLRAKIIGARHPEQAFFLN